MVLMPRTISGNTILPPMNGRGMSGDQAVGQGGVFGTKAFRL